MHSKRSWNFLAALAVAALSAGSASASIQTYTSNTTWGAALTGGSQEADQFYYQNLGNPVLNVQGYGQFIAWGSAIGTNNATFTTLSVGSILLDAAQNPTITIAAPTGGTNATLLWLGANVLGSGAFSSQTLTVTLTDVNNVATTFTYTTGSTSPGFFGFTSGTAISTIAISAPTGYDADLMDFYAGTYVGSSGTTTTTATPECGTLLLLGSGLIFFGARRKFAQPATA
jgi:hypothetical protein